MSVSPEGFSQYTIFGQSAQPAKAAAADNTKAKRAAPGWLRLSLPNKAKSPDVSVETQSFFHHHEVVVSAFRPLQFWILTRELVLAEMTLEKYFKEDLQLGLVDKVASIHQVESYALARQASSLPAVKRFAREEPLVGLCGIFLRGKESTPPRF